MYCRKYGILHLPPPFYQCVPLVCNTHVMEMQLEEAGDTGARHGCDNSHTTMDTPLTDLL